MRVLLINWYCVPIDERCSLSADYALATLDRFGTVHQELVCLCINIRQAWISVCQCKSYSGRMLLESNDLAANSIRGFFRNRHD